MPFDANKFNFTRVKHDEILFELSASCDGDNELSTSCDADNESNMTVSFK